MQLHLSSWPEIMYAYLAKSKAILIPIGSTEQDRPERASGHRRALPGDHRQAGGRRGRHPGEADFDIGQAQHHMAFSGTITLRPSTMIAAMCDWRSR